MGGRPHLRRRQVALAAGLAVLAGSVACSRSAADGLPEPSTLDVSAVPRLSKIDCVTLADAYVDLVHADSRAEATGPSDDLLVFEPPDLVRDALAFHVDNAGTKPTAGTGEQRMRAAGIIQKWQNAACGRAVLPDDGGSPAGTTPGR